jgi:hypothetical protein
MEEAMDDERERILRMVQAGKLSAEDGGHLLDTIEGAESEEDRAPEPAERAGDSGLSESSPRSWGHYWLYLLAMGIGVALLGMSLIIWLQSQLGFTFWSVCCSLPLIFGLFVVAIAAWSTQASWVHVRVTDLEDERRNVAVSVPLPITLTILALRITRHFVREMPDQGIEEVLGELRGGRRPSTPLMVDVYDDKEHKRVQVRIG